MQKNYMIYNWKIIKEKLKFGFSFFCLHGLIIVTRELGKRETSTKVRGQFFVEDRGNINHSYAK